MLLCVSPGLSSWNIRFFFHLVISVVDLIVFIVIAHYMGTVFIWKFVPIPQVLCLHMKQHKSANMEQCEVSILFVEVAG
jgi:hypothetical protein